MLELGLGLVLGLFSTLRSRYGHLCLTGCSVLSTGKIIKN